jgi:mRNA-degrading endonuclease RelE of RelBE toxin-antitoxin system
MRIIAARTFEEDYAGLPPRIQKAVDRKLRLLLENPRYPSLRIKKMHDPRGIWEARVTSSYRFTFQIAGDVYILRRIGTHDILQTP